jgi:hypothetical protein
VAGLAHRLDDLIEADEVHPVAVQRQGGRRHRLVAGRQRVGVLIGRLLDPFEK